MKINRVFYLLLCFYIFQLLVVPLIHHIHEQHEEDHCTECHTGEQINSTCDGSVPCNNPTHHHHDKHGSHDAAHCIVCKVFLQDIDSFTTINIDSSPQNVALSNSNGCYVYDTVFFKFSNRSPPLTIS